MTERAPGRWRLQVTALPDVNGKRLRLSQTVDGTRADARQHLKPSLGVDEVLVDRGELTGEHLIEELDDRGIALHVELLLSGPDGSRLAGTTFAPDGSERARRSLRTLVRRVVVGEDADGQ